MDRRTFLSSLLATGALCGAGPLTERRTWASPFASTGQRMLVSVLLSGGPDLRHMMPPPYSEIPGSFGFEYWQAMASSHGLGQNQSELQSRWVTEYDLIGDEQHQFGLLRSCGWLKQMWENGNVAIVSNVLGSSSRNHPLSVLVSELGDRTLGSEAHRAPGVGGRLAEFSARNVLSLTPSPRPFCYGPAETSSQLVSSKRVVSARNTRAFTLFDGDPEEGSQTLRSEITRNVAGYYAALTGGTNPDDQAQRFIEHENKLRVLGAPIDERLDSLPVPASLERLYRPDLMPLYSPAFGLQVRNLYDSLACADILNMGVASMEYKGFDTHRLQLENLEPRLHDLFGEQQAMDSLFGELPDDVANNLVLVFSGEFGRQIRANGDGGTDHGEGSTVLIVGRPVTGGIYGDLFPQSELDLRDHPSPQIRGLTAIERIHALVAEWHTPGASAALFPNLAQTPVEQSVDLDAILPKA